MHKNLVRLALCLLLFGSARMVRAREGVQCGTCFAITRDGLCLTNAHVVKGATGMKILANGHYFTAHLVAINENLDLAVVQSLWEGNPLRLRSKDDIVLGTKVWTTGFPHPELQGLEVKVTEGIISSLKGSHDNPNRYQHSAAIQSGNSGGPLFDEKGAVAGIVVSTLRGDFQNVNYAIKAPVAYDWLTTLPAMVGKSQAAVPGAPTPVDAVGLAVKATAMLIAEVNDDEADEKAPPPVSSRSQAPAKRQPPPQQTASAMQYSQSSKKGKRHNSTCRFFDPTKLCGPNDGEPCKFCGG